MSNNNLPTITITCGLPGSGKSSWANSQIEADNKTVKVEKDALRAMLANLHKGGAGGRKAGKNTYRNYEKLVVKCSDNIIATAINDGFNVIVSDTNLNDTHINRIKQKFGKLANIVINDVFLNTPLDVCIANDLKRPDSVGKDVIMRMYYETLRPDIEKVGTTYDLSGLTRAVIVDLDGTMAYYKDHRGPFDASTCDDDKPYIPVRDFVALLLKSGCTVLFTSGREDKYIVETTTFLNRVLGEYLDDETVSWNLFMRKEGDNRADTIIKKEIYDEKIKGKYSVAAVIDDRPCVVRMWRDLGLFVFDVGLGYEF